MDEEALPETHRVQQGLVRAVREGCNGAVHLQRDRSPVRSIERSRGRSRGSSEQGGDIAVVLRICKETASLCAALNGTAAAD